MSFMLKLPLLALSERWPPLRREYMDLLDSEISQMIEKLKERESFIFYLQLLLASQSDIGDDPPLYRDSPDLGESATP